MKGNQANTYGLFNKVQENEESKSEVDRSTNPFAQNSIDLGKSSNDIDDEMRQSSSSLKSGRSSKPLIKEGYLWKKKSKAMFGGWNKRFVALEND